jgi:hypothetical protein
MVDVQIRFSAEIPFGFEPERKERLILDVPPSQYYTAFDFWEEERPSEPQIREEKRENDEDSNWEKPQPAEIEVKEQINIENNNNQMETAEEDADAEFLRRIEEEIAIDRQNDYFDTDYYDCCDEYEEDYELEFFHAKKANPKRLRNTSHYKKEKINPDRCINAYTQKREEQRIELIAQNHSFAKGNAFAKYGRLIPAPQVYNGVSTYVPPANNNYTQYNRANNPNIPQSELDLINQAIQASLRTQVAPAATGLSANQLLELQTRDLTPEDYELLLALDESVKKKTLTKTQCASFPSRTLDEEGAKCLTANPCSICFGDYECGEKVRSLPCDHTFHNECIDQWLTTSSISCPLCKTSLEVFFEE